MDVELDDFIRQQKREKGKERKGNGRKDRDGDVQMGSSRGPNRRQQRQRKPRRDAPYSRNSYNTSGDASQDWKHDLFGKDEDEVEHTGWGTSKRQEGGDLIKGTAVIITNLHYEISDEELKVICSRKETKQIKYL